jgi:hypothetical protein
MASPFGLTKTAKRLPAQPTAFAESQRQEAGVNKFPRFLRSKNLKLKNGMDAIFEQRKGEEGREAFPPLRQMP